jgi:hypothetical protein
MKRNIPQLGDRRIIKKFLVIPCEINNEVRWLETAYIIQICRFGLFRDITWDNFMGSDKEEYDTRRSKEG